MNAADNGIIAAKNIIISFTAETVWHYRPICFGKIGAQEHHVLRYGIAYTRSQFRNASWGKGALWLNNNNSNNNSEFI